jgi:hypothetical protein
MPDLPGTKRRNDVQLQSQGYNNPFISGMLKETKWTIPQKR